MKMENTPDWTTLRVQTTTGPTWDIVVKFVDRYRAKAHNLLAGAGLAPKLFFYGSPRFNNTQLSYESISMVVMEYIDGETLTMKNLNEKMAKGVRLQLQRSDG